MKINFNNPFFLKDTKKYINQVLDKKLRETTGGKIFYKKCNNFLEKKLGTKKSIITNSCTSALEIAALLLDIKKNDEIIMPSYTFVSTANAFVLRGAKPVFAEIKVDDLNIDETKIEKLITKKTKAIVAVHYAGIPCEMNVLKKIAKKNNLYLIEDAAQAIFSKYKKNFCGTIGDIGCLSFHETKNITSCEGGAILINNKKFLKKASIICNKGTDREFFNKNLKKYYSWKDIGSSFIPSEITCSILYSQLKNYKFVLNKRKKIWKDYKKKLKNLNSEVISRQINPKDKIIHNYHMYYMISKSKKIRDRILKLLVKKNIISTFHYIPLHLSSAGKKYGIKRTKLNLTEELSEKIIRLPLWIGVKHKKVINQIKETIKNFK